MPDEPLQKILSALRLSEPTPCSGENLSTQLGVSRAQIWKHISQLRKRGYEIDGAAGGGYRLVQSPDRLYAEEIKADLNTQWLAREIVHFEQTESTNQDASDLARKGAAHGTTVIAESQTAGRGRLGRDFYSPAHQNLYTSIVLRPALSMAEIPTLLLSAGLAVARTVSETLESSEAVEIKWPNDVLIKGLKTSGILMELEAEENRITSAILGIGVNLNIDPKEFPEEFRRTATSLGSQMGRVVDRVLFAQRLFQILEQIIDLHCESGFKAVRSQFESFFKMKGKDIRVAAVDGKIISGRTRGIAANGALEIEMPGGQVKNVLAGDVTICKPTNQLEETENG
ncbi:MAG: biotin--[acetyl-CoA-carboxylase] ligase [Deltaproteobacteria bacterium]|nr:biotin--[acetyl-CoA-carboxylase] ligase [Deltaproteobacteria bacterium]